MRIHGGVSCYKQSRNPSLFVTRRAAPNAAPGPTANALRDRALLFSTDNVINVIEVSDYYNYCPDEVSRKHARSTRQRLSAQAAARCYAVVP